MMVVVVVVVLDDGQLSRCRPERCFSKADYSQDAERAHVVTQN